MAPWWHLRSVCVASGPVRITTPQEACFCDKIAPARPAGLDTLLPCVHSLCCFNESSKGSSSLIGSYFWAKISPVTDCWASSGWLEVFLCHSDFTLSSSAVSFFQVEIILSLKVSQSATKPNEERGVRSWQSWTSSELPSEGQFKVSSRLDVFFF